MDVSVVIAAYNAEAFIGDTLKSVLAHDIREAIVVNDGSTDATVACVRAAADSRLRLVNKAKGGVSAARNSGAAEAQGQYLFFIDADDILLPGGLEMLVPALCNEGVVCAYGNIGRIQSDGTSIPDKPVRRRPSGDVLKTLLIRNFIVSAGNALVSRDAFEAAGKFDEHLTVGEEWELWCRLALRGYFWHVNAKILNYRMHRWSAMAQGPEQLHLIRNTIARLSANQEIRQRLGDTTVERLLIRAEARCIANLAMRNIGVHKLASAGHLMLRSMQKAPAGIPELVIRGLLACMGRQ